MKVLWFCPICKREEIKNELPNRQIATGINIRDGFGTPIHHYKCECGNENAGAMDFRTIKEGFNDNNVKYFKYVIKMYQDRRFGIRRNIE